MTLGALARLGWLCLLAAGARAAEPANCESFGDLGCLYAPASIRDGDQPTLLIYFRGWRAGDGRVPASSRVASSREAFETYGLREAADGLGLAALVTGSSDVGPGPEDVRRIEEALDLRFSGIVLAAHSGGYAGLARTLDAGLPRVERLILLDSFYFDEDLARRLGGLTARGVACSGYLTAHNLERYETRFKPNAACAVEQRDDLGHEDGVGRCLPSFLSGVPCRVEPSSHPAAAIP